MITIAIVVVVDRCDSTLLLLTDVIVRETYEPEFWKIAFSCKQSTASNVHEFTALSVSVKDINPEVFTTDELQASSSNHTTG